MAVSPSPIVRVAPPCPACDQSAARHLDEVSKDSFVDFYDCATCHHLWAVDKRDQAKVRHITPFVRSRKDRRTDTPATIGSGQREWNSTAEITAATSAGTAQLLTIRREIHRLVSETRELIAVARETIRRATERAALP